MVYEGPRTMVKMRAIAVGFGLSAYFIMCFFPYFFLTRPQKSTTVVSAYFSSSTRPIFAAAEGINHVYLIYYILGCLAAGFFLASFYPRIEGALLSPISTWKWNKFKREHVKKVRGKKPLSV